MSVTHSYPNSSLSLTLVIPRYNDTIEEQTGKSWRPNEFRRYNIHSFKRWKVCDYSNHWLPYRTQRVWPLLDYNISNEKYNLSWMWLHTPATKEPDFLPRGLGMNKAANKSKICYLPKSNVDFILEYERENTYWFESLGVE